MKRLNKDEYFIAMAQLVAIRATCLRRKVGCVLTNSRGHVIATGYNGRPAGAVHCLESPCPGVNSKSGQDLDKCEAIHAEANALLQCKDVHEIYSCYTTSMPCVHCVKLLMNTSCEWIIYKELYADKKYQKETEEKWIKSNIINGQMRATYQLSYIDVSIKNNKEEI